MTHLSTGGYPVSNYSTVKNWFAVFTMPRHEKQIERHFVARVIDSFLPLCQTKAKGRDGSKKVLQLPLFSNYIFVHIDHRERRSVLEVPGVISIVGGMKASWPVPDSYIHFLREGLRLENVAPCPYLAAGTKVRIHTGVMAGMEGILLRRKNDYRVVLTLEMIMRSVTVEVAREDIAPVDWRQTYRSPIAANA